MFSKENLMFVTKVFIGCTLALVLINVIKSILPASVKSAIQA